jgi:replicative DNA helicase
MAAPLARTRKPKPTPPPPAEETEQPSIDRLPPSSHEAEQGVLGCVLLDPDGSLSQCVPVFKAGAQVFFDMRHRTLYECLLGMWDQQAKIDIITVQQRLKDIGRLEDIGGLAYLAELPNKVPSAANLEYYTAIVLKKFVLRRVIAACAEITSEAYKEPDDVSAMLAGAASAMDSAAEAATPQNVVASSKTLVPEAMDYIELLRTKAGTVTGLPTGFIDLDMMTWGLQPAEMFIVAGRPSSGKTSLAMNIAENVATAGFAVGVFSMEMSRLSLMTRMLCSRSHVSTSWVRTGNLSEHSAQKLTKSSTELYKAPLFIDDSSALSVLELRARARRMHKLHNIRLFVVDYLQLMHASVRRNDNRQQEVSYISSGLKALAKDLGVAFLVCSQLNRKLDDRGANAAPKLSDLRESGSIEQDADVVVLLHKPNKEIANADGSYSGTIAVSAIIAKQRNGPTGEVNLVFLRSCTRFESASKVTADDTPPDDPTLGL